MDLLAELELEQQVDAIAYLGFKTYGAEDRLPRRRLVATRKVLRDVGLNPRASLMEQPSTMMHLPLETGLLVEERT